MQKHAKWIQICAAGALLLATGCPKAAETAPTGTPKRDAAPVRIAPAETRAMPIELSAIGAIEPLATIALKSQVAGEIIAVSFTEGDLVQEGQELFRIDTRPFELNARQAEAQLAAARATVEESRARVAQARAESENATTELGRNQTLLDRQMVTREEFDQSRTRAQAARASLTAQEAGVSSATQQIANAQAQIDRAKLDLEYCSIKAPITGRTGSLMLHRGDLVRANDTTPLVTIVQVKPIYVSFTVPERHLPEVRARMADGPLQVHALLPGQEETPVTGTLTFIDNLVDQTTSTIRLKATFDNEDERLWPGQFVRVLLQMSIEEDAIVVPTAAVMTGQRGTYVYAITPELTADMRLVKTGITRGPYTVITDGLASGEKVITDGHVRVAPGAPVSILDTQAESTQP